MKKNKYSKIPTKAATAFSMRVLLNLSLFRLHLLRFMRIETMQNMKRNTSRRKTYRIRVVSQALCKVMCKDLSIYDSKPGLATKVMKSVIDTMIQDMIPDHLTHFTSVSGPFLLSSIALPPKIYYN